MQPTQIRNSAPTSKPNFRTDIQPRASEAPRSPGPFNDELQRACVPARAQRLHRLHARRLSHSIDQTAL